MTLSDASAKYHGYARTEKWLKRNHAQRAPHSIIFFDTETKPYPTDIPGAEEHKLWFGWAIHVTKRGDKWSKYKAFRFTTPGEFFDYVESKARRKQPVLLMAHNFIFDASACKLFTLAKERGYDLHKPIIQDPPTIIKWKNKEKGLTIKGLDSLNYWRTELSAIGKWVGVEKLPFPTYDVTDKEVWDRYCYTDTLIIAEAYTKYIDWCLINAAGNIMPTLASQAFACFRHSHSTHPLFINNSETALRVSRAAYYGARTEAFYTGKLKNVHCLDVNSLYPYIMKHTLQPTILDIVLFNPDIATVKKCMERRSCILSGVVKTVEPRYAMRHDSRLVFPVGTFPVNLCTGDIKTAINNNELVKITELIAYIQKPIFSSWVDHWYSKRLDAKARGDIVEDTMTKGMLNQLYGRFGMSKRRWETIGSYEGEMEAHSYDLDATTGEVTEYRAWNGIVERRYDEPESAESMPEIAAHITSYAREYMYSLYLAAGRDNVFYSDTDSVIVNDEGLNNLRAWIDPLKLGYLRLEWSGDIEINGVKDYHVSGQAEKIKGIKKTAVKVGMNTWLQPRFRGWAGMRRADEIDRILIYPKTYKTLNREYKKGTVLPSGKIIPLVF